MTTIKGLEYKDFTRHPEKLLTEGKENNMVKVNGIARACEIMLGGDKLYISGLLELGKEKFVELYGEFHQEETRCRVMHYLQASSESNQEIQVKGLYNKSGKEISVQSFKLGNLEEICLPTKLIITQTG